MGKSWKENPGKWRKHLDHKQKPWKKNNKPKGGPTRYIPDDPADYPDAFGVRLDIS